MSTTKRHLHHRKLKDAPLTAEDWRQVHDFMRVVVQPYMEMIAERARRRAATTNLSQAKNLPRTTP